MTDEETLAAERCAARLLEARALLAAIDEGELFADAPAGAAARRHALGACLLAVLSRELAALSGDLQALQRGDRPVAGCANAA